MIYLCLTGFGVMVSVFYIFLNYEYIPAWLGLILCVILSIYVVIKEVIPDRRRKKTQKKSSGIKDGINHDFLNTIL